MIRQIVEGSESRIIYSLLKESYDEKLLIGSIYETESCLPIIKKCIIDGEFYGLYLNNDLQAFIQLKKTYGCLFLNHIVVRKDFKSKGYGKQLFEYYKSVAEREGLCLALEVDSRNENAFIWYSSLGFKASSVTYKALVLNHCDPNNLSTTQLSYSKCDAEIGYSEIKSQDLIWSIGKPSNKTYVINYDEFPKELIDSVLLLLSKKVILLSNNNFNFNGINTWKSFIMKHY